MEPVDSNMNIKTPRTDVHQSSPQTERISGSAVNSSKAAEKPASDTDTVTLTDAAADILKLEEKLANIPDIDDSRVAEIKASIADGSYQVEAEKIVNSLLNIERDLL
ncbi:MAG: flagellar biosynthesis anti-sigma factor FlgM [Porticoccaceae bacterium]|nr:flagellar biosynthesis anti-sigma factor FlgM [Pseudomonadales bacterium]